MSRLSYIRASLIVLFTVLTAVTAAAQAVIDPRIVEFDPSPDHNAVVNGQPVITRYDLEVYLVGATQPSQTVSIGKPAPQGDGKIRVDFTTLLSLAPGPTYEARVVAVGGTGVGRSTESNTFTFTAPCTATLSPTSVSVNGAASTGSVAVTVTAGCAWTATSGASWLTITSGASGSGNGTVAYAVAANPTTSSRSATLTIAGQTFTVTQNAGCSYTITPSAASVSAAATTGSVSVTTLAGCNWTASSSASWITVTSGANGSGNGSVGYSVTANTSTSPRTGTLTIAGRTFTLTQDGAACTYVLSPVSATVGSGAASGNVAVTAATGCAWTASSSASWITITAGSSGSGNGQVSYSVSPNATTSSRTGNLTIGGQTFTITQAGQTCTFSLSPVSASVPAGATSSNVSVDTLTGCSWTAVANATWISITSGGSGTGDGTVAFNIAANTSLTSRTGTLTIGGQTFTVTQAGVVCTATLAPVGASVVAAGAQGTVAVTLPGACTWTASSGASWITIDSGTSGTGNGSVTYTVAANTSTSSRSGSLTIAGQTFTVTQAGITCTYTVNPAAASAVAGAGSGTVTVTSAAGCTWTASSSVSWMTISSGASGSGNGTVTYAFTANPTTQTRAGVLTVAGQAVTITQAAGCGYSISPVSASVAAAQTPGTINVTAGSSCAWTAQSPVSWITFSTPTSGTGIGSVGYVVAANASTNSRSATLTVAGQSFVLTQAGLSCTATLNPTTQNIVAGGANGSVTITVAAGCAWTAVSSAPWITVLTGASGTGNGTVTYRVDPNLAGASRTGTISIGGQQFTITQAAAPCTATLSPTSESTDAAGGARVVSVTIPSACSWTAASNVSWITVTAGAGPNTNGSAGVTYNVAANTSTSSRSGTLTIAGLSFTVTQAGIPCTYTVNPTAASAVAGAGTGTVSVTSPAGCAWTASSSVSWMTINSGASGSGNGTVTYDFTANPTTQTRSGVLTVAGQAVTITQAAGCGYSISPASASVGAALANGTITVTAGGGCAWTASSPVSWITFSTSTSGTGNGSVGYVVAANTNSSSRSATLTVAGQPFVLTQAGATCTATLNPTTQNIVAGGANGNVDITVPGGCAWTAVPSASWITVLTGASGTGNGTVTYSVAANPAGASRTGTIAIGGQLLTVTQAAAACTATLSPTSDSTDAAGGARVVSVTIPSACSWTAASNVSWITVTAGAGPNTSGSAAVTYNVAANSSTTLRTGTLTIAGLTFTVTQAGMPCTYTVNPTSASVVAAAGSGTVAVTSPAGCSWTASSSVSWMTISSGASGSGNGTVTYAFTANPTTELRVGVLTVAGQAVTVTQIPGCGYKISPSTGSHGAGNGTGRIHVTAGNNCTWSAQSSVSWVTFSSGLSGTGDGDVDYVVAANTSSNSRSTTLLIAGEPFVVTQAGASCDATLTPGAQSIVAAGANASVDITVPDGCAWTAVSSASWITVLTGASGTGNGTITYRVDANPTGASRTGTIAIGGRLLTVTQAGAPCTSTVSSTSEFFEAPGGPGVVSVTIPSGCLWSAVSNAAWITITSGAGPNTAGSGAVTFTVAANTSTAARTGTLTVAGRTVTVDQAGTCDITIAPSNVSTAWDAATGSIAVTTGTTCSWSATSSASWLTVTGGSSGVGNGTVLYAISANTGSTARSATLNVGGRTFTVTQAPPPCSAVVSPTSVSLPYYSSFRTVQVSIAATCAWTASSSVPWITIATGASGTGSGTVSYSVTANSSNATRSGTLTIAGQTVTVTQTGVPCTIGIAPTAVALTGAATNESVAVTTSAGCQWTASSNVSWVTITSGSSGNGDGSVQYSVAANPGAFTRVGTMTIAGLGFTVTQAGNACNATLSPTAVSVGAAASNVTVNVSAGTACSWTASSSASWVTVTGGATGTGPGTVTLAVAAYTGTALRSGTVTIAGRTFTVTQSGACDYSVSPTALSVGSGIAPATISVTAGAGCAWSAQSPVSWVTLNNSSGSGNGLVSLTVAANTSALPRTATLTVADSVVSVTQAGAACNILVSPVSLSVTGGTRQVAVTGPTGCAWTATTTSSWMTLSNPSGSGNGTVDVTFAPNPGPYNRSGIISIGLWRVFVTQGVATPPNAPQGMRIVGGQ